METMAKLIFASKGTANRHETHQLSTLAFFFYRLSISYYTLFAYCCCSFESIDKVIHCRLGGGMWARVKHRKVEKMREITVISFTHRIRCGIRCWCPKRCRLNTQHFCAQKFFGLFRSIRYGIDSTSIVIAEFVVFGIFIWMFFTLLVNRWLI